jgi:hypothetical protein
VHIQGDTLTPSYYTAASDQTRALIFTPLRSDWNGQAHGFDEEAWQYKNRVREIADAIRQTISGVSVAIRPYVPESYATFLSHEVLTLPGAEDKPFLVPIYTYSGDDALEVGESARGSVWFQYGPSIP